MFAVVRVRGIANVRKGIADTLEMLRLDSPNQCVLVPEKPEYIGMLKKAKDYITWGRVGKETLAELLEKRGKDVKEIPEDLLKERVVLKKTFKLNPPKKGYKKTRLGYPRGALGFRKDGLDSLLKRMI